MSRCCDADKFRYKQFKRCSDSVMSNGENQENDYILISILANEQVKSTVTDKNLKWEDTAKLLETGKFS